MMKDAVLELEKIKEEEFRQELGQFTGTVNWYRHRQNAQFIYTDGVRHLIECYRAIRFIDMIALEVLPTVKKINDDWCYCLMLVTTAQETGELTVFNDDDAKLLLTIKLSYSTIPQISELRFVLSCVDEKAEVFCLSLSSEN